MTDTAISLPLPPKLYVFLHEKFDFSLTQEQEGGTLISSCASNNYSKLRELVVLLNLSEKQLVGQISSECQTGSLYNPPCLPGLWG